MTHYKWYLQAGDTTAESWGAKGRTGAAQPHPAALGKYSNILLPTTATLRSPNTNEGWHLTFIVHRVHKPDSEQLMPTTFIVHRIHKLDSEQLMPTDCGPSTPDSGDREHLFPWDSRTGIPFSHYTGFPLTFSL